MSVQQNAGVVLPATCAVAASFDPALARSVGAAQGQAEVDPNIKRSPLCGRNFAMFSEDPHLTAALAAAVVGGAQNAVVGPLLCCSQVTDAPDRRVDERTLQEIYLPPAAASLQAGPQGVRYGSGTLNGVPLAEAAAALLPQPAAKTNDTPSTAPTHALAVQLAAQCGVLVQNLGALPLKAGQRVAYIGAFAETPRYYGEGQPTPAAIGALDAALLKGRRVGYVTGFPANRDERDEGEFLRAVSAAEHADVAVVFAGLPENFVSPDADRRTLRLPDCQNNLIARIAAVQKNTVVVLHTGTPVECPWAGDVSAVLCMYLAGEGVGEATDALLWGDANPSGRLPETWPLRLEDTPCYLDFPGDGRHVEYREGVYVGYRWYDARKMPVLWPFGHGLSYTGFVYRNAQLTADEFAEGDSVRVRVSVKNVGMMPGKEVVQLYVADCTGTTGRPPKELRKFVKVKLEPGEEKQVELTLAAQDLSYYDETLGSWYAAPGEYKILLGHSSRDIHATLSVRFSTPRRRPFVIDENTTIGELSKDDRTAAIIQQVLAQAGNALTGGNAGGSEIASSEAVAQMLDSMPLRGIVNFGGPAAAGMITPLLEILRAAIQ